MPAATALAGGLNFLGTRSTNDASRSMYHQNMDLAWHQYRRDDRFRSEDYRRQKQFAMRSQGWAFDDLMRAADRSGIHRLSALGSPGGAQYTGSLPSVGLPSTPNLDSPDFGFIGDAASDVLEGIARRDAKKRLDRAEKQGTQRHNAMMNQIGAETEYTKARTKSIERASKAATTGGTTGATYPNSDDIRHDPSTLTRNTPSGPQKVRVGPDPEEVLMGYGLDLLSYRGGVLDSLEGTGGKMSGKGGAMRTKGN